MTADETTQRDGSSIPADRTGKVFAVLSDDMRLCLICEVAFTPLASREHATVHCRPAVPHKDNDYSPIYPTCVTYAR
jgi:hypothetical protein